MGFALLALLGATSWGVGDFLAGLASRRAHVLTVLAASQAVGLVGVAIWVITSGAALPSVEDLLPAVGAGAAGAIGLAALYRGLAVGAMGIVAPISAASPIVPLAVDVTQGVVPSALQWVGIAVVLFGIVLLAREPSRTASSGIAAGVLLALVAALGFGLFIVGLDASSDGGVALVDPRGARDLHAPRARRGALGLRTDSAPRQARPRDRRGRRLRHGRERARRIRDDPRPSSESSPCSALCTP